MPRDEWHKSKAVEDGYEKQTAMDAAVDRKVYRWITWKTKTIEQQAKQKKAHKKKKVRRPRRARMPDKIGYWWGRGVNQTVLGNEWHLYYVKFPLWVDPAKKNLRFWYIYGSGEGEEFPPGSEWVYCPPPAF